MFRRLLRKYQSVVQMLLLLVGGALAFSYAFFPAGNLLGLGFFSLGTAIVSTAFVSMLNSVLGTDIPTLIEQRLQFNRQVYDLGLENIYLHIGDESIFRRFQRAHSIDMMYNTAKNASYRYMDLIEQAVANQKCRVRILISDPENTIWKNKNVSDGLCPGTDIPAEVADVINRIRILEDDLKRHKPPLQGGAIELRKYKCAPTGSIVIVDSEVARYTPYMPYSHSSQVPIYDVVKERGHLFDQLQRTFERVWNRADTVFKISFHQNLK